MTLYYYGGNIHPREEWSRRLEAIKILAGDRGQPLAVRPYDTSEWLENTSHLASEPEGGERCVVCMKLQLRSAAAYAASHGFEVLCTSLTLSPQKHPDLINTWGREIAREAGLEWEERIWRKKGGFAFSLEECRRLGMYRQNYCGCLYSLRERREQMARSGR